MLTIEQMQNLPLSTDIATQEELNAVNLELNSEISSKADKDFVEKNFVALSSVLSNINDGILTFYKNGVTVASFSANQSNNTSVDISVPDVSLQGNTLTVNGNSINIPNVSLYGNSLTVDGNSVSIPYVSLQGNSLTVNGNYVSIPSISLFENSLTVDGNSVSIPSISLYGNSLTVNGNSVNIPSIQTDYNSLSVNGTSYYIPTVSLDGNSLTVNGSHVSIPTSTSQLSNDSGFLTRVGDLDTSTSNSLNPNSKESFSGDISLHRISKTGDYEDLLNKPNLSVYALTSDLENLISTVTDELSSNINPKLNTITDLVSAEVERVDDISANYVPLTAFQALEARVAALESRLSNYEAM